MLHLCAGDQGTPTVIRIVRSHGSISSLGKRTHGEGRRISWDGDFFYLVVVEPTYLKNMRSSNWIISPRFGVKIKDI